MKIKKILLASAMAGVCACVGVGLSGCFGKASVSDIEITSEPIIVTQGQTPDFSGVSAKISFSNNTEKNVTGTDLIFGEVSVDTIGETMVTVKYKDDDFSIEMPVLIYSTEVLAGDITAYSGEFDGQAHPVANVTNLTDGASVSYSLDNQAWTQTLTIQDAGNLDFWVKFSKPYHFDKVSNMQTATVTQKEISAPLASTLIYEHNGQPQTYTPEGFDAETMNIENNVRTEVGAQTVTVTPKSNYVFAGESQQVQFEFRIYQEILAVPTASTQTFVYDKTQKTYIPTGFDAEKMSISGNTRINAGTQQVVVTPKTDYVFEGVENATFEFTIEQREVSFAWYLFPVEYNGSPQTLDGVVEGLIQGDTCYGILEEGNIYVGTYTARLIGLSNPNYKLVDYQTMTCNYTIRQGPNQWSINPGITAEGTIKGEPRFGTAVFEFKVAGADDSTYTTTMPTTPGTYEMRASVAETENYKGLVRVVEFTIAE